MRSIAAVALTTLLAACASSPSATPESRPVPVTAAAPAPSVPMMATLIPDGTYATTITRADAPSDMSPGLADSLAGRWTLSMTGFHFVARFNGAEVVSSDYHSIGNQQIHFPTDDVGPMACHADGVYRVAVADHQITYTKVRDECTGRAMVLTAHPLVMQM